MNTSKLITENLLDKVADDLTKWTVKPDFTDCWIWFGSRDRHGYGIINTSDGHFFVHRIAYRQRFPEIDIDNLVIRHKCDNPSCVNPDHLIPGTQQDNLKDAYVRGRVARGERVKGAKLTTEKVSQIRQAYRGTRGEYARLAKEHGVNPETIRGILS